ncbi:DUF1345 domain-containing protein [Aureimonas glaciei]|uniref:Membrane protein n=1 Tax=Aureimonas glaciei TaxID=1776957 RepID=A0A916V2M7_9HYPH|nr:DUF1345 domain-containing protein [Aureimonas glaciei]GGD02974.1 membrane protein [Aureimonas glaciei]
MLDNPYTRHHKRFLLAAALAILAWWPLAGLPTTLRLLVVGDVFFFLYLALLLHMTATHDLDDLRQRAQTEDEGIVIIALLTLAAIGLSLVSIFGLINRSGGPEGTGLWIALVNVPLGWASLHAMAAQHYGRLYYGPTEAGDGQTERGGLDFPGEDDPGSWHFLYFSFVIGMTAQTADVAITAPVMRRVALAHSVASFFFNTVLVALAVNVAVAVGAR